jgi:hypothetical protein
MTDKQQQLIAELEKFTKDDIEFYEFSFLWVDVKISRGVKFMAESCSSYFLIYSILNHLDDLLEIDSDHQIWTLKKINDKCWQLICSDKTGRRLCGEEFSTCDFPLDEIKILLISGRLLLPSEF